MSDGFKVGDVIALYNPLTRSGLVVRILSDPGNGMWCVQMASDRPRRGGSMREGQFLKERFAGAVLVYRPDVVFEKP